MPGPPKVCQHTVRYLKDPVRRVGDGGVMGNHDDGLFILPGGFLQQGQNLAAVLGVQVSCGLVG